ncbi:flagellar basal-body MS-ring/collar protein FliF [Parvibium lacunae]|uniref:Flagellar M-ring protein n=1 Tax=Parvibium lacunae TaxID=1888893 RepID=A0A368L5E0_9BURK|nr:flagellar basal-body MS-ring/collar protein FliF [Parvibium lacunae]RCS58693.1 flagellar basal body M-ring protein FliF [Parvibium lacunae]
MAEEQTQDNDSVVARFRNLSTNSRMALLFGLPLVLAALVATMLYSKEPDYRILFTNVADRDGGAILTALGQMNVPYKMIEGGGIMIPADKVHETRLRLASQGLPKGSIVGFELMENQKLGVTQFQEQVNYQRALEGELSRSIQALASVQSARVHLAIPKPTVFIREQQKPTASVLVNLYPGRSLERTQIAGIVHLVSSSLPELTPKNVSVIDQNGVLLSNEPDSTMGALDPSQMAYVQSLEQNYAKRIMDILSPIIGAENVRAQVTAEIDFSQTEQTAELYKPNGDAKEAAIRSQQILENANGATPGAQGVPGALSNQPPGNTSAPISGPGAGATNPTATTATSNPNASTRRESTVNYEVDKTVRYTKNASGAIKRLSAAVVLNHKTVTEKGKTTSVPLTEEEIGKITALAKEAIGFSTDRGDKLNVMHTAFNKSPKQEIEADPFWKTPEGMLLIKDVIKYGLIAGLIMYLLFGILKPAIKDLLTPRQVLQPAGTTLDIIEDSIEEPLSIQVQNNPVVDQVREFAKQDPRVVATVVQNWVKGNE